MNYKIIIYPLLLAMTATSLLHAASWGDRGDKNWNDNARGKS